MTEDNWELPKEIFDRVARSGLATQVVPPRPDRGLEYVRALQNALKDRFPEVRVAYFCGEKEDWMVLYFSLASTDLFGEDPKEVLRSALRCAHGLPVKYTDAGQKIPNTQVAGVRASLCSTNGTEHICHHVVIGPDKVIGAPRHKPPSTMQQEKEDTQTALLLNISASGNQAEVLLRTGPKWVPIEGSTREIQKLSWFAFQRSKKWNKKIPVQSEQRSSKTKASSVLHTLTDEIASLEDEAANDYGLSPPPSSDDSEE